MLNARTTAVERGNVPQDQQRSSNKYLVIVGVERKSPVLTLKGEVDFGIVVCNRRDNETTVDGEGEGNGPLQKSPSLCDSSNEYPIPHS